MRQRIHGYIAREIQHLTNDEDLRQELWIYVLEGNSILSLEDHLKELLKKRKREAMEHTYGFKTKL